MHNVTVIFTRHDAIGNCNSIELLRIMESIIPEVVFEELPYSVFEEVYIKQSRTTLESDAVKMYSEKSDVEHIPVDTFVCPVYYHSNLNHLLDSIGKNMNKSARLKTAVNQLVHHTNKGGFGFLNSAQNDVILEDITEQENHLLAGLVDDELDHMALLRREVDSKREDAIIGNIYKYSEQRDFHQAILFIGSGHRKSIKSKLEQIGIREEVEIKWHFLDN